MNPLHPKPNFPFPLAIRRFLEMEASSGMVMLLSATVAILMANSQWHDTYISFIEMPITFGYGHNLAAEPLKEWIKDILMVFFFFMVGLELKREIAEGFLSRRDQILLPLFAALGGMAVPTLIFLGLNYHVPANITGWAIPSATDIAFALCILMLVGRSVPASAKIFLLAIAIFDDLGAILIIAFFYSGSLNVIALGLVFLGILILCALNRLKVGIITPYLVVGIYLWFCLYHSGIHTTIAGVLVGLLIPMRWDENQARSPVNKCIHFLHPWVGFFILPAFAFTSAGISFEGVTLHDLLNPLTLGIAAALFIGKQIGIFGITFGFIKLGFAKIPEGASWRHIYGISILAGIGFTMSLFIGALAFPEALQAPVKLGVICGSLLSTLLGAVVLSTAKKTKRTTVLVHAPNAARRSV